MVTQLSNELRQRPNADEMANLLEPLFASFPVAAGNDRAREGKAASYLVTIREFPPFATKAAIADFICGRVDSHTGRFLPTAAELAKVVRAHMAEKATRLARRRYELQHRKANSDPPELTPQQRARRAAQVAKAKEIFAPRPATSNHGPNHGSNHRPKHGEHN